MFKHFFFDLDNTLTRSKSHIEQAHMKILVRLTDRADVVVVSGHDEDSIHRHLGPELIGRYYILSQNGNHAEDPTGRILWERKLTPEQVAATHAFIAKVRERFPFAVQDPDDLIEDRGCEVAFSLIGHHEDIRKKEAFDHDGSRRKKILDQMREEVAQLAAQNVEVRIGGTTVLDFMEKGKNKGFNVRAFMEHMHWRDEEAVYVGDALFPGGNDETVIGVIPTKAVKDYKETYAYLSGLLAT